MALSRVDHTVACDATMERMEKQDQLIAKYGKGDASHKKTDRAFKERIERV